MKSSSLRAPRADLRKSSIFRKDRVMPDCSAKFCLFLALWIKFPGSTRKAHSAGQVLKTRIRAERIEARP